MTRIFTALAASTAILAGTPALATNEATDRVLGNICEDALSWTDAYDDAELTEAEIAKLRKADYAALDANADGTVTQEEYVACRGKSDEMTRQSIEKGKSGGLDYVDGSWQSLVKSEKLRMTADEWAEMSAEAWRENDVGKMNALSYGGSEAGSENAFARASAQRFRMQDADNDGVLTKEEYEGAPAGDREADYKAKFEKLDSDASGDISAEEYAGTGIDRKDGEATTATPIYLYYFEVM